MLDDDLARAQLRERLAINERYGLNGLNTKLDDAPVRHPDPAPPNVGEDVVETPPPEELKAPILAGATT